MNILRNQIAKVAGLLLTVTIYAVSSQGAIIGVIYQGDPTGTDASLIPSTNLPNAAFTTNDIDFNTHFEGGLASSFLGSIDTSQPNGHTYQTFTNQQNGFDPNASIDDSFIQLTGATYLNAGSNVFNVTHEGGAILTMAGIGIVLNQPTSSNPPNNLFLVNAPSAGYYNFVLNYVTGPGPVSDLTFQVNYAPVGAPEPASIALLGSGLVAVSVLASRRRQPEARLQNVATKETN